MGSNKTEQSSAMGNDRRDAISAFVDAHFPSGNTSYEQPICTPGEFQKSLQGHLVGFVEANPYLGCELMGLNHGERWHARKHFQQRWQKLQAAAKDQAMTMEYKRTLAIPLVDRLQDENTSFLKAISIDQMLRAGEIEKEDALELYKRVFDRESTPASATILASEYLLRWRAGQADDKTVDFARALLEFAADQGDPQACYMLANEYLVDDHLCKDAVARSRYHEWAVRCGHKPSIEKEEEMRGHAKDYEDTAHDGWLDDEELQRLNNTISQFTPKADTGDPDAQYIVGMALIDKQNLLIRASGAVNDQSVIDRAMYLIKEAAPYNPRARYSLVWLEEPDSQRALELLQSAAFPPENQQPYFPALLPLAERLTELGNVRGAEDVLRFAINKKEAGEKLNGDAELQLAKLLDEHALLSDTELKEARELYLAYAKKESFADTWPSLRAAVMCLRGEGGPQDIEKARTIFEKVSRQGWGELKLRYFAELGYTLGWGKLDACTRAPELLTRLLALNDFQVVDRPLFGVEDVKFLLSINGEFQQVTQFTVGVSEMDKAQGIDLSHLNAIGYRPRINYRRLIFALCNLLLSRGSEEAYYHSIRSDYFLDRYSMLANHVLASLVGAGRLTALNLAHARGCLEKVGRLYQQIVRKMRLGPNHLRAYEFVVWLGAQANYKLQKIQDREAEELREQAQRDMLSYLTHTLNNVLSGRPEAARQAMRVLGSDLYENNAGYTAINNIASMMSTFLFAQQLVSTFKIYIADPDALRKNWETDREGESSIATVLAMSLRQTLSQLVFASNQLDALDRLLNDTSDEAVRNIRKSFMDEMIPLDVSASNAQVVFDWVKKHIGAVDVSMDPVADLHFHSNSTRFTFFFSVFSELIFNALKYSDAMQPIQIAWKKTREGYIFRCENSWSVDSISNSQGSDKGLVFLDRLTRMLGARLDKQISDNRFIAEINFPEHLFKEEP